MEKKPRGRRLPDFALACMLALALAVLGAPALQAQALPAQAPAALSGASAADRWSIQLSGLRSAKLGSAWFDALLARQPVERSVEKKGEKLSYRGLPLSIVIAMVDGEDAKDPFVFDEALWKAGYSITLVARDGYSATFSTKDLAPDALMIAATEGGKIVAPMTVGDSPKNLWVRDLVAIETSLAPLPAAAEASAFRLALDINGTKASFSLAELEASELWLEDKGSYTTSAGTRYSGVYGGVGLRALLERYTALSPEDSIRFTATDGYEMTYPGSLVLDSKEGSWILAFKLDGDWLPKDPGFVRTVKVGPGDPNIDGHLSVRMVKTVTVKQKDFKDFALKLEGRANWTLDRSTIQSCVSCHKASVSFEKKGQVDSYAGFPAWLILGYVDDPSYAPHRQDKAIPPFDAAAAAAGYKVEFASTDGFMIGLDSRDLSHNDEVILALYKNGLSLPDSEFPLTLVWDRKAKLVPAGIKNARMITLIRAKF
jgi:hypothetical protein